jgi:hypothetical protein
MSDRGSRLVKTADEQISEFKALLSTADRAILRDRCPEREKLGDGTVGALALHIADTYLRIAAFVHARHEHPHVGAAVYGDSDTAQDVDTSALIERLKNGSRALRSLADLTDEQLDAAPAAGRSRFCDG